MAFAVINSTEIANNRYKVSNFEVGELLSVSLSPGMERWRPQINSKIIYSVFFAMLYTMYIEELPRRICTVASPAHQSLFNLAISRCSWSLDVIDSVRCQSAISLKVMNTLRAIIHVHFDLVACPRQWLTATY